MALQLTPEQEAQIQQEKRVADEQLKERKRKFIEKAVGIGKHPLSEAEFMWEEIILPSLELKAILDVIQSNQYRNDMF